MRDERVGAALRAVRIDSALRQSDLAAKSGVSQSRLSLIEHGDLEDIPVGALRAVFEALGGRLVLSPQWHGAALDRLLDERHAVLSGLSVDVLRTLGWETLPEVTFSEYGERGSIDVLGLRERERVAVVFEIKTDLPSLEETQRRLDVKARLVPRIVYDRVGWRPATTGKVLVVPEGSAIRRQLTRHSVLLEAAFPHRGREVRRWLRSPVGGIAALWVLSNSPVPGRTRVAPAPQRVRRARRSDGPLANPRTSRR